MYTVKNCEGHYGEWGFFVVCEGFISHGRYVTYSGNYETYESAEECCRRMNRQADERARGDWNQVEAMSG